MTGIQLPSSPTKKRERQPLSPTSDAYIDKNAAFVDYSSSPTTTSGGGTAYHRAGAGTSTSNNNTTIEALDAVLTKENAHLAGEYIKLRVHELAMLATDGDQTIRTLAIIGGFAMVVTSTMGMIGKFLRFAFFGSLMSFYTTVLGIIILTLETRSSTNVIPEGWIYNIYHYALFLKFVWGRGCTYFVAGSLQASQWNAADTLVGLFMMFIGIMYVMTGRTTARKLTELRTKTLSKEVLMQQFYQFVDSTTSSSSHHDQNNHNESNEEDGTLDLQTFQEFMDSLGMTLDKNELDTAFVVIDTNQDSKISFDEFYQWWTTWSLSPEQLNSNHRHRSKNNVVTTTITKTTTTTTTNDLLV